MYRFCNEQSDILTFIHLKLMAAHMMAGLLIAASKNYPPYLIALYNGNVRSHKFVAILWESGKV